MRKLLKMLLNLIHKLLVYFMVFGVLLPEKYIFYFVITWPCIYLHWQLNNNRCILTELEYYLDNKPYPPTVDKDHDYPFIKSALKDFGVSADDIEIHYGIMYGFTILWIIGMIRYFKFI